MIDEILIMKLEKKRTGANTHTINRSLFWYKAIHKKMEKNSNEKYYNTFVALEIEMRKTLISNDYKKLLEFLQKSWW